MEIVVIHLAPKQHKYFIQKNFLQTADTYRFVCIFSEHQDIMT
jgi:hypothetical protein